MVQKLAVEVSLDETSLSNQYHIGVVGHYTELGIAVAADSLGPQSHQRLMNLYLPETEVSLALYLMVEQNLMDRVHGAEEVVERVVVGAEQDEMMMVVH